MTTGKTCAEGRARLSAASAAYELTRDGGAEWGYGAVGPLMLLPLLPLGEVGTSISAGRASRRR